jgi:hypothetical protein
MDKIFSHKKKGSPGNYLFSILALLIPLKAPAQPHPLPVLSDTSKLGQYTSRTMYLLHESTPDKGNDVRILVYGQSISEQEWWLEVRRAVRERFPYAHIVMENKAIGGFSTQYLFKTVEMDVSSFYPDLVLLHIYGNAGDYETVLSTIRSRTTAEVSIMTDHYTGENKWSDTMSYFILPSLAEKYRCDIVNIRDPWKAYLKDNNLEPSALLKDGIHLNDFGNFLMAELVKPLFYFKSSWPDDPFKLLTKISKEAPLVVRNDTLILPFYGNRVDLVYKESYTSSADSSVILLDGLPPSTFPGCYYMTRPYNTKGEVWPWDLPAMIRVEHTAPWTDEEWSCVFTRMKPPYNDFRFSIAGSVTGRDGRGRASSDFISRSGKVIIKKGDAEKGGDWHLNRSYRVLKTIVNNGDTVKWRTYPVCTDIVSSSLSEYPSGKKMNVILFQGVPNTAHVLKIAGIAGSVQAISMVKIYRPYWNR